MSLLKFKSRNSLIRIGFSDLGKDMCIYLIIGAHAYKSVGVHICIHMHVSCPDGGGGGGC